MQERPARLTVVIPCYNEAANIPLILKRFKTATTVGDIRVLLVDNGSTDNSASVLENELKHFPFADTIRVPINQGYGYGILQGLNQCRSDFLGWTHADMQTDPHDLIKAFNILKENNFSKNLYVKGERRGRPFGDTFFTFGMSVYESLYLGVPLWDINAQPNIFHRSFFESWESPPFDFSLDLYASFKAYKQGLRMLRFDVLFPERQHGASSWNSGFRSKMRFIKRTLEFSVKLKKSLLKKAI
jgi:glycosyltransferase involved in cell wall biosynthesis